MTIWPIWIATERRFLPNKGGLVNQSASLMADLFKLDSLHYKMQKQWDANRPKKPKTS